ncbi:MAG: GTP 3',8-cyclase MoaA [Anaerolineales bacterium]
MTSKNTLPDGLGRQLAYLRISLTDQCNFRCTYCMPARVFNNGYPYIPRSDYLSFDQLTRLASVLAGMGVRKIRLTGGEPLTRKGIEQLVGMLIPIPGIDEVTMTTNGYLLAQTVEALKRAGLSRLNVSLDSLDPQVFREMNGGRAELETVLGGIEAAEAAGFDSIKINAVVKRGVNDHGIVDLVMYFRKRGLTVRFIEYMDTGTVTDWHIDQVITADEMIDMINESAPIEPLPPERDDDVARRYRFVDGVGEIGFITSVSDPFCGGCTRLRLTADGKLYTCLFGAVGHDLRKLLLEDATDGDIVEFISKVWRRRSDRYSEVRSQISTPMKKVEMNRVGG